MASRSVFAPLRRLTTRSQYRTFSTTAPTAVKKEKLVQVQLIAPHPTLGAAGSIVKVPPGRMRQVLFPEGQAAYLVHGQPLPFDVKRFEERERRKSERLELENAERASKKEEWERERRIRDLEVLREKSGSELVFHRRTVNAESRTGNIHGSVTAKDVVAEIMALTDAVVSEQDVSFFVNGTEVDRVREIGKATVKVQVGSEDTVRDVIEFVAVVQPEGEAVNQA